MFLALKSAGATDWSSGINISVGSYGTEHKLQFHHIFPKAQLRGKYPPAKINDIGNLAFVSGRTNRTISAKRPAEYLPEVLSQRGERALVAQCVPSDSNLWEIDEFEEFLVRRRELLAHAVNDLLGPAPT
jgi:hypothetical protein